MKKNHDFPNIQKDVTINDTMTSEETKGDESEERGRSAGIRFDAEIINGTSRPISAAIRERSASPPSRFSGATSSRVAKTRPATRTLPNAGVIQEASDETVDRDLKQSSLEVTALDQVYTEITPVISKLNANAEKPREMVASECREQGQRVQHRCIIMLENKLQLNGNMQENIRSDSTGHIQPDPATFTFWYDDLVAEVESVAHEYLSSGKEQLRRQVENERNAWMKMAQLHLDSTQDKHGASEAAIHVDVLVYEFKQAEADMMRWELHVIQEMQYLVESLMNAWKNRAKDQIILEREMYTLCEKNPVAFRTFLPAIHTEGKAGFQIKSPVQQRQLEEIASSLQNTTIPASHTENTKQLTHLQQQILEWKRHALRHIEKEASIKMSSWRNQIDNAPEPEDKIAIIDKIELEREKYLNDFAVEVTSAEVQYDVDGNIIKSSQESDHEKQWKEEFKKSMAEFRAKNPLLLETKTTSSDGSSSQSPIGPSARSTVRLDVENDENSEALEVGSRALVDSVTDQGILTAEEVVADELKSFEIKKQLEIDQTIRERKLYAQAELTQKLKEEAEEKKVQERMKAIKEAAEREEAQKLKEEARLAIENAEKGALEDMEAEWARLQMIMARDKEKEQARMKREQEAAEVKYGVTNRKHPAGGRIITNKMGKKTLAKNMRTNKTAKKVDMTPPSKKKTELGKERVFDDLQMEAALVTRATKAEYNVSITAESEIFKSFLSKEEKMEKLEKLELIKAQQRVQSTASAYSGTFTDGLMLTTHDENPLDSNINPLAPQKKSLPSRDDAVGTGLNTVVDPRIKFSRADRPVIVTVTPKEAREVRKVVEVRENSDLMSMLDDAKKKHLGSINRIYTEEQPKLILGQKHTSGTTSNQSSKPGSPSGHNTLRPGTSSPARNSSSRGTIGLGTGSTNNYRAFTPDDRNPDGRVVHKAEMDEYEDDGFMGMQRVKVPLSEEEAARQSERLDGRPNIQYLRPAYTPENPFLHTRNGKHILDSKLPEEPRPLSPSSSLYGSGAINIKAYSHVPGNDGTIGLVTEKDIRELSHSRPNTTGTKATSSGNFVSSTQSDASVSEMANTDILEAQRRRLQGMTEEQRNDFVSYHGPQILNKLGSSLDQDSLSSGHMLAEMDLAKTSSKDSEKTISGTMKALPDFVNRPLKHLTATGTTSLGISGSPDAKRVRAGGATFKCPHPSCNASFNVAFELFNHANRFHQGVVGDIAHNPVADQDYYYEEPDSRDDKSLSHSNSASHRHNDPFRSSVPVIKATNANTLMNSKQFVKKIRIPADQVINRKPRVNGKIPTKKSPNSVTNDKRLYEITAQHSGSFPALNTNAHYDPTLMNPTLGTPTGSYATAYNGGDDAYSNSFLSSSYQTMNSAKAQYMQKYANDRSPMQKNIKRGTHSPLARFSPAVVCLSRKWEEQQQMDLWASHTKLLKDWRKTYEKQLSLKTRALPNGNLSRRTRDNHVTKADPRIN